MEHSEGVCRQGGISALNRKTEVKLFRILCGVPHFETEIAL